MSGEVELRSSPGIARLIGFELLCAGCLALPMGLLNGWWMAGLVGVLYLLGLLVIPTICRIAVLLGLRVKRDRRQFLWSFIDDQRGTPALCGWMGLAFGANYGWAKGVLFGVVIALLIYPFHIWSALRGRASRAMPYPGPARVPVLVEWEAGEGGKIPLPPMYVTVARFPEERGDSGAWSVVLEFDEVPRSGPTEATARFLEAEGPCEWLRPGAEFELLAGFAVSARVRVI